MRSRYRLATFDGDMTLWDFEAGMRAALEAARRRILVERPDLSHTLTDIQPMIALRDKLVADAANRHLSLAAIRRRAFAALLAEYGPPDEALAERLYDQYLRDRLKATVLYPDVTPLFAALDAGLRLGLLSNGHTHPAYLGIAERFHVIAYAGDTLRPKPAPDLFEHAIERLGCRAEETIHIGDSLATDIAGANAVGATSVWLNRDGRAKDSAIVPDHTITSLDELNALLYEPA